MTKWPESQPTEPLITLYLAYIAPWSVILSSAPSCCSVHLPCPAATVSALSEALFLARVPPPLTPLLATMLRCPERCMTLHRLLEQARPDEEDGLDALPVTSTLAAVICSPVKLVHTA